ncbi:MAG: hypothetical protein AB7I19_07925 [Planctomycetota bacterium]
MSWRNWTRAVVAKLFGLSRSDWRGRPGRDLRRALARLSERSRSYRSGECFAEFRSTLREAIEDRVIAPHEKAVLAAVQAEELRARAQLHQRTEATRVERARLEKERVRTEITRSRAEIERTRVEALCRFLAAVSEAGIAFELHGNKIQFAPSVVAHDPAVVRELMIAMLGELAERA